MFKIELIKVGNHWYPNINHSDPECLVLDPKLERILNFYSKDIYAPTLFIYEIGSYMPDKGVLKVNEEDLNELYVYNPKELWLRASIDGHDFYIKNSTIVALSKIGINLSDYEYKIEIW